MVVYSALLYSWKITNFYPKFSLFSQLEYSLWKIHLMNTNNLIQLNFPREMSEIDFWTDHAFCFDFRLGFVFLDSNLPWIGLGLVLGRGEYLKCLF